MSLDEYYEMHKNYIELPTLEIFDSSLVKKFTPVTSLVPMAKKTKIPSNNYDSSWANRCTYKCGLCEKIFNARCAFKHHVLQTHDMSMAIYFTEYGRTVSYEEKHH